MDNEHSLNHIWSHIDKGWTGHHVGWLSLCLTVFDFIQIQFLLKSPCARIIFLLMISSTVSYTVSYRITLDVTVLPVNGVCRIACECLNSKALWQPFCVLWEEVFKLYQSWLTQQARGVESVSRLSCLPECENVPCRFASDGKPALQSMFL